MNSGLLKETHSYRSSKLAERHIGDVLSSLLAAKGLTERELSRKTGILQQTINCMIRGETKNPRVETALTLATFFGISIQQLLAKDPINLKVQEGAPKKKIGMVPVMDLENVKKFSENTFDPTYWIECDESDGDNLFALRAPDNLEPMIRQGSVLLVNPHQEPNSGDFVVVSLDNKHSMIRIFISEGGKSFIKPFDPTLPTYAFALDHQLLGTITQIRFNMK